MVADLWLIRLNSFSACSRQTLYLALLWCAKLMVVDDNDLFGRMVAAGLRSIEDNRKRALCKLKIHEVMFNFQFGPSEDNELLNPASSTASTLSLTTLWSDFLLVIYFTHRGAETACFPSYLIEKICSIKRWIEQNVIVTWWSECCVCTEICTCLWSECCVCTEICTCLWSECCVCTEICTCLWSV